MWYIYVLKSQKDGRHYIGFTSDLEKRLLRHNSGGNISTKHRRPLELIYSEQYEDRITALRREKEIKSWKGGEMFKKLLQIS
ncbi:MAG: GIY-YIG nuclease family protein [Patescibacteria group bacterium]